MKKRIVLGGFLLAMLFSCDWSKDLGLDKKTPEGGEKSSPQETAIPFIEAYFQEIHPFTASYVSDFESGLAQIMSRNLTDSYRASYWHKKAGTIAATAGVSSTYGDMLFTTKEEYGVQAAKSKRYRDWTKMKRTHVLAEIWYKDKSEEDIRRNIRIREEARNFSPPSSAQRLSPEPEDIRPRIVGKSFSNTASYPRRRDNLAPEDVELTYGEYRVSYTLQRRRSTFGYPNWKWGSPTQEKRTLVVPHNFSLKAQVFYQEPPPYYFIYKLRAKIPSGGRVQGLWVDPSQVSFFEEEEGFLTLYMIPSDKKIEGKLAIFDIVNGAQRESHTIEVGR